MKVLQPIQKLPTQTREWSDWVTPILVKELRQGTRETSFVISFLFLQISLAFLSIVNLGDARLAQQNRYLFDDCLFGVFLFVLPFLSAFSLSQEVRQNTLETLLMTHLSAWGLVFGKWVARAFQSFLIALTVLPYFILQYISGGEQLFKDLILMIVLIFGNLFFSAIGLSISVILNGFVKYFSLVVLMFFCFVLTNAYEDNPRIGFNFSVFGDIFLIIVCVSTVFIVIEMAATEIGADVHNRPIYRRLSCLGLIVGFYLFHYLLFHNSRGIFEYTSVFPQGLLFLLTLFTFIEVSRAPLISKRLMRPYSKFGPLGKFMVLFFMPGWPSAFLFCLPAVLITFLFSFLGEHSISSAEVFAYLGSILIPLVCNTLGLTRFAISGFVLVGFNLLGMLVIGIPRPFNHLPYPKGSLPFVPCFATLSSLDNDVDTLIRASISCTIMITVLCVLAIPWLRKVDQAWKEVCAEKIL